MIEREWQKICMRRNGIEGVVDTCRLYKRFEDKRVKKTRINVAAKAGLLPLCINVFCMV